MLKELIALWKGHGIMNQAVEAFGRMIKDDEFIFSNAWGALQNKHSAGEVSEAIHERDRSVNSRERQIRRLLLEHLSVNPGQDVSGCLTMMSLVKDAERIGDYSKNIFDLGTVLKGSATQMKYFKRLSQIHDKLVAHLKQLERAFLDSNQDVAKAVLADYEPIKKECSEILDQLFEDEVPTQEAVATALLSRFLKRINSHICNIATGLVYPIDQIDFVRGGILD